MNNAATQGNTMNHDKATVLDAIDRSRQCDEIVHVEVDSIADARDAIREAASADDLDYEVNKENDGGLDFAAYRPTDPEYEMVWRVVVHAR